MIKDYFIFGGVSSRDFGVIVESAEVFGKPAAVLTTEQIPGRNGDLLLYDNRFENVPLTYKCHCDVAFLDRLDGFYAALASQIGYQRLEDSVFPDHFRRAYLSGGMSPRLLRTYRAGSFSVEFSADPRKFLKAGEAAARLTQPGKIYNPTMFTALPLLRFAGTAGTAAVFDIGGTQQISFDVPTGGVLLIDVELGEAYLPDGTSYNRGVSYAETNVGMRLPEIAPGENAVTFSGLSSVEITPRWWTL